MDKRSRAGIHSGDIEICALIEMQFAAGSHRGSVHHAAVGHTHAGACVDRGAECPAPSDIHKPVDRSGVHYALKERQNGPRTDGGIACRTRVELHAAAGSHRGAVRPAARFVNVQQGAREDAGIAGNARIAERNAFVDGGIVDHASGKDEDRTAGKDHCMGRNSGTENHSAAGADQCVVRRARIIESPAGKDRGMIRKRAQLAAEVSVGRDRSAVRRAAAVDKHDPRDRGIERGGSARNIHAAAAVDRGVVRLAPGEDFKEAAEVDRGADRDAAVRNVQ